MAFSSPTPTLAKVLAAGADANGATITNLAGLNSLTFTSSYKVLNVSSDGGLFMHGATLAMNVGSNPGTGGGEIFMEGGAIRTLAALVLAAGFPQVVGASGVVWNDSNVLNVSP